MAGAPLITRARAQIAVKIPRVWAEFNLSAKPITKIEKKMTEDELLRIVEKGETEYKEGKTKVVGSVMDLLGS